MITKVRIINEFESEFPRVLICNANEFTTLNGLDFLRDSSHLFSNYKPSDLDSSSYVVYHNKQALRYVTKAFSDEQKKNLSHSLEKTIIKCSIDGKPCDLSRDFEWVYNDFHGNCFVFNSGKNKSRALRRLSDSGKAHGLYIQMYVGMAHPDLNKYSVMGFNGAKIYINNNSFKSLYEDQLEILAASGSHTNIGSFKLIQ